MMRTAIAIALAACSQTTKVGEDPEAATSGDGASGSPGGSGSGATAKREVPPLTKSSLREKAGTKAFVVQGGTLEPIDPGQAEAQGYTLVDLSDDWTPYIFTEKTPGQDDTKPNAYRERYLGLAADAVDQWGEPLDAHEQNYLELYGIPPTLSVIWREWQALATEVEPCLAKHGYDGSAFGRFRGDISYSKASASKRVRTAAWMKAELFKKARKAKLDPTTPEGLQAAASHPKTKALYKQWRNVQDEVDVIANAQKRFVCEGMFRSNEGKGSVEPGEFGMFDAETTHALASFERKHDIMGWGHFKDDNLAMLAKPPVEAVHARLLRMIEERVTSSAGIVEDGSAAQWKKDFRWKDKSGKEQPLRDLVSEFTQAAIEQLDVATPQAAAKAIERFAAATGGAGKNPGDPGFVGLVVALKLPPLPEYYAADMAFETLIDRGDVWYDFPYDDAGNKKAQPRQRYPHLTLSVKYEGQSIPLVHWRTTIGSWRNEFEDGEVVLKYKNSDVGARVWKDIMAAPVWIPPATTPPEELVKGYWRKGKFRRDVNYPEIGPGYRSAYGLVAAYHIRQNKDEAGNVKSEFDNSIRTHGSVDYMSILRRFSHGCHRLYNMDAVRMFSFILQHRAYTRVGPQPVGVRRNLEVDERTFVLRVDSRGYKYELVEPVPVMVTEGRIRGRRQSPITAAMHKPGSEPAAGEDDGLVVVEP
ncbi:MAG: L,D-transpeptidase [Nannocystaceae bacterium]|nr:L,D-transpeptidase [Nannocystaceae bacterium]